MSIDLELFRELTETSGVPGYEDRIREIVRREFENEVDEISTDPMGNVVGTIEGDADYTVAVEAHIDEIGFMIKHVDEDGFLRIEPVGYFDERVLRAQRVTVHTEEGDLVGIIGSTPPHVLDGDEDEDREVSDIHIDVGLSGEELTDRVSVGDPVSMEQTTVQSGNLVTGKALDDRACLFTMLQAAKRIDEPEATVHFAAAVQEEVGFRGAEALSTDLDPDTVLVLDVTMANDIPGVDHEADQHTALGEGTAIKLMDGRTVTNRKVNERLSKLVEERDIPHQFELFSKGGTDASVLQNGNGATATGAVSVPTRYLHTVTETAHVDDIAATIDLITAFVETESATHDYTL